MQRIIQEIAVMGMLLGAATGLRAATIDVPWTGSSDFDSETILFLPFTASSLESISSTTAYFHSHGSLVDAALDILLDGSWTTLVASSADNAGQVMLADLAPSPIRFSRGAVSGLRLTSNPGQGNTFHSVVDTSFNFGTSSVPEPDTLGLLISGVAGLMIFHRIARNT